MNLVDFLFEDSFSSTNECIVGGRENASYWYLYRNVTKVADYLVDKVGRGKHVLLAADNSQFFITAYLAIVKSGNICIPIDSGIEKDKFEFIKRKTRARFGFFSRRFKNRVNPALGSITESLMTSILRTYVNRLPEEPGFDGEQTAEILFTSGSTAEPKGVVLSHNNIIANTRSIIEYLGLTSKDRVMVVLPFHYCYGLSLLHTHLRVGGSLVLNNSFIFLGGTIDNLNKLECTGFAGVPSHFQILLRKTDLFKNTEFKTLRYCTQAGGKLHDVFIKEFTDSFPGIQLFVMYGQTEATARLSYLPPEKLDEKLGSVGKGIPGVELIVTDEQGKLVAPGETGEICAKGDNIMKGYFEDPVETSIALRDGWLHTGDLGTVDNEGYIYLTARKKEMIKIGGKRVSPKEIEEVIVTLPGVVDCTVEGVEDEILGESLLATVVVNQDGKQLSEEDIKRHCSASLASFKIPSHVVIMENLTLSASGKRVKKA